MLSRFTIHNEPLDIPVEATADDLLKVLRADLRLLADADARASDLERASISGSEPGLYVSQREYAVVPLSCGRIVGSDAATTCHILIAVGMGKVLCTHLDGVAGQEAELQSVLLREFAGASEIDVHMVGGFHDDESTSWRLALHLLGVWLAFSKASPETAIHLKTVQILDRNSRVETVRWRGRDQQTQGPIVRAMAYDTRDGRILLQRWFADHGPDEMMRAIFCSFGRGSLRQAVDPATLAPLPIDPQKEIRWPKPSILNRLLGLTADEDFLEQTSTSPLVEHAEYATQVREKFRWAIEFLRNRFGK